MEPLVFAAVLVAALMHAGWNALVKVGVDRFASILLLSIFQSGIAVALLPAFEVPAAAAWPWLIASGLLHTAYKIFLIRAYEHGDLSQVYPLARGTAPLIVALIGALFLGEMISWGGTIAVLAIAVGVMVMSLRGGTDLQAIPRRALIFALATASFTAAYTLVDAVGARLSGTPSGFTMWLFVIDGIGIFVFAAASRGKAAFAGLRSQLRSGFIAGLFSLASYWIAIWAFTQAPVALVAALRETSVLFAMLISVVLLKERANRWRWTAAALILSGVVLMRS